MRIAIDLTPISYHLSGIERYAICMADRLIEVDKSNSYIFLFRNNIPAIFEDRIDGKRIKAEVLYGNNKLFFLQFTLLKALKRIDADKYFFFAFPGPFFFTHTGVINTIHDMGAWDASEEMTALSKYYFRLSYFHAAKTSEKLITVSEFSKSRIHEILGVPNCKIEVIYSAVYKQIVEGVVAPYSTVKEKYELPDKYIMTLSTLEPRKNMKVLLEAFNNVANKVDYDLVLVGRKGWKIDDVLSQYEANSRIHLTGFVEDDYLSAIYKNALCFVFPSLYEGFGLPPVEALALGVPVISSDAASLPEILMNQAIYFHNNSRIELESLLRGLGDNVNSYPKGLNDIQAKEYSFSTSAEKVLSIICMHD